MPITYGFNFEFDSATYRKNKEGGRPMPTLNWIGKDKVVNYHLKVPYHVLERKYSFDEEGQHEEDNGSENMIIHGDNLLALKSLFPKYEGKIKCMYIEQRCLGLIQFKERYA